VPDVPFVAPLLIVPSDSRTANRRTPRWAQANGHRASKSPSEIGTQDVRHERRGKGEVRERLKETLQSDLVGDRPTQQSLASSW